MRDNLLCDMSFFEKDRDWSPLRYGLICTCVLLSAAWDGGELCGSQSRAGRSLAPAEARNGIRHVANHRRPRPEST